MKNSPTRKRLAPGATITNGQDQRENQDLASMRHKITTRNRRSIAFLVRYHWAAEEKSTAPSKDVRIIR